MQRYFGPNDAGKTVIMAYIKNYAQKSVQFLRRLFFLKLPMAVFVLFGNVAGSVYVATQKNTAFFPAAGLGFFIVFSWGGEKTFFSGKW